MKVVDLTHTIRNGMPVYPGCEGPALLPACSHDAAGFRETSLSLLSHTGTHIDAPAHVFPDGKTLDAFPPEHFIGEGIVLDCTTLKPGKPISVRDMKRLHDGLDGAEYVLFRTGWSDRWGSPAYFEGYPCIDEKAADYLLESGKKGIGFDSPSVDPVADAELPLHKRLLAGDAFLIVENLTNLETLLGESFTFCALPLKYEGADGAPARALAII